MSTLPHQVYRPPMTYNTALTNVAEESVVWLAPGWLAEGFISVMDGDPGKGKSTIVVDLMARITTGRPLPGGKAMAPAGALLFHGEDSAPHTIKPRARIHGADMSNFHVLQVKPDGSQFLIPNDLFDLEALVETLNIKLIVFDPIYSFVNADMTKSQQVRQAFVQLQDLLIRHRCSTLFLRHFNKNSQSSDSMYRGEGSIAIAAISRMLLTVGDHPTDPHLRAVAGAKNNLGALPATQTYRIDSIIGEQHGKLSWEGVANSIVSDDLLVKTSSRDREEQEDMWFWAEAQLPMTVKEMEKTCRDAGYKAEAIKEVLRAHGVKPKPVGLGGQLEYRKRQMLEDVGVLECVGCGGIRYKGQDLCPACGTKPMKIVRNQ